MMLTAIDITKWSYSENAVPEGCFLCPARAAAAARLFFPLNQNWKKIVKKPFTTSAACGSIPLIGCSFLGGAKQLHREARASNNHTH
ncbi:MAG: hypothetical protein O7A06_12180 [Acidobacteria bacterium]|nr:hypothetical protein [Acidobacteriota bacterium]